MNDNSPFNQKQVRQIVVLSTGLGLALAFASLASLRSGLVFVWNWSIPFWMAAAVLWNWKFWSAVWRVQSDPTPQAKRNLAISLGIMCAIGIAAFLYPIRFVESSRWLDISKGLATDAIFLGILGWLIYRAGRIFADADAVELKRLAAEQE